MLKKIFLIQISICLLLVTCYIVWGWTGQTLQEKRADAVASLSKHYTVYDIWQNCKTTAAAVAEVPVQITDRIISSQNMKRYTNPVDDTETGSVTPVYAVSGGQVIETGTNDQYGKFIKIRHDGAVSFYGNCSRIYIKSGEHVRRGQIIGSYKQEENNEFYYELIEE